MAINLKEEDITVICSIDEAVTCDDEGYAEYLETLDETKLKLKDGVEPTRFMLRRTIPYAIAKGIKSESVGVNIKTGAKQAALDDATVSINMGYTMDEVRATLADIKNPGSPKLTYRTETVHGVKVAHRDLIATLNAYGMVDELHRAWQTATGKTRGADKKK